MLRTFEQHLVRTVDSLDGWWAFVTADERTDRRELPPDYTRRVHVPSAWEMLPGLETYRGRAWYRTEIEGDAEHAARLVFGGVSHTATVYVDGKEVGGHYDAFTPWDVVVPGLPERTCEVVVAVDNSFGEHSALHIPNDYMTYGGITRPVEVQYVPPAYIDAVFATPAADGDAWRLDVTVRLKNWSDQPQRRQVVLVLGVRQVELGAVTVKPGQARTVRGSLEGLDVPAWAPDAPHLHTLWACLLDGEELVDDLADRVGFREVATRGREILLNGEPIRLRGFNRHEDHPQFGCALPVEAMVTDLELLRDLGANFVRTCHYPNDMRFLDLCDELGLLVWEESHARTVDFSHPHFREQIAASTREMVEWHFNHPSIALWGCLNECESDTPAGKAEHARVLKLLRQLDGSRPVTFASNRRQRDLCMGLVGVVSINTYPGWYDGRPADAAPRLDEFLQWLHSPASNGGADKPLIVSEFGAGAIPGYRQRHPVHWTEQYQAEVLDATLQAYLNHKDVSGAAVWQLADVRITEEGAFWRGRPRTMNNKGVVDEFRRPKLAYETVKRHFRAAGLRTEA